MILFLQTLCGIGHISLRDEHGVWRGEKTWQTHAEHPNLLLLIAELLQAVGAKPSAVSAICALQGPGPFTAVRTLAVLMQIWKQEQSTLSVYAIPTGIFLRAKFPEAETLLLSAGSTAFFSFTAENPRVFEKHANVALQNFTEQKIGGILFPEQEILCASAQRVPERPEKEVFLELWERRNEFQSENFLPIYGAEPNIRVATAKR